MEAEAATSHPKASPACTQGAGGAPPYRSSRGAIPDHWPSGLPFRSGSPAEGTSEAELRQLPGHIEWETSLGAARRHKRELAIKGAAEDQPRSRNVVSGRDHEDASPVTLAHDASNGPSLATRRRRLGDDRQHLKWKAPRCQKLGSNRFRAHNHECRCGPSRSKLDGSPQPTRPITIERNDRISAARKIDCDHRQRRTPSAQVPRRPCGLGPPGRPRRHRPSRG